MTDGRAEEREARWEREAALKRLLPFVAFISTVQDAGRITAIRTELDAAYEAGRRAEQAECMAVDERDGGYETWPVRGHVQKNDGSVFTPEEADALIDAFLDFWESRGMGFGGGIGVPARRQA